MTCGEFEHPYVGITRRALRTSLPLWTPFALWPSLSLGTTFTLGASRAWRTWEAIPAPFARYTDFTLRSGRALGTRLTFIAF